MKKLITICSIWLLFTAKVDLLSIPFLTDMQDMVGLITDISDITTGRHDLTAGNLFAKKTDATLMAVNHLSQQISELTDTFNLKMDKLMTSVLEDVPRAIQLANLMRKLIDITSRVDELYEDYVFYVKKSEVVNKFTIEEFGRVVTSHKYGDIPDLLTQAYHLFVPGSMGQKDQSILEVMVSSMLDIEDAERCNQFKTPHQHLYDIYETVIITEMKGFTMTAYAFAMLGIYHNATFTTEIDRATYRTIQRCNQYLSATYTALEKLQRDILFCDPPEHIKGETYIEINPVTRIVTHENMMTDTCYYSCSDIYQRNYKREFTYTIDTDKYYWYPNHPCQGYMYNCFDINSINFCELSPESKERYKWMETFDNVMYGFKDSCPNGNIKQLFSYLDWYRCTTCFCECSEEKAISKANRTFSLRPQIADIDNNMIVTGVRFEQKDKMIHVQIEEGKLLSAGQIDKSSLRLKELEDFKYLEEGEGGKFVKINGDDQEELEHGVDYQFIRYKQRDVYLDNVHSLEPGYVVTGLKMSQDPENSKAIQLDIYVTPFNFTTGMLEPTDDKPSKWITHKDMPGHDRPFTERKDLDVTDYHRGDDYTDNVPDSEDFADTWFVISSRWSDMSQSTVPFMDRQLAAPSPRVPFDGVSIFHRGRSNSAGFLAFKVRTIGLHHLMNPQMNPESEELYQKNFQEITDLFLSEVE